MRCKWGVVGLTLWAALVVHAHADENVDCAVSTHAELKGAKGADPGLELMVMSGALEMVLLDACFGEEKETDSQLSKVLLTLKDAQASASKKKGVEACLAFSAERKASVTALVDKIKFGDLRGCMGQWVLKPMQEASPGASKDNADPKVCLSTINDMVDRVSTVQSKCAQNHANKGLKKP
jgi:hypothetical protein